MNTTTVLLQINGAINVLRRAAAVAKTLPQKYAREFPTSSVTAAIRGLEIAKAEINGEPWPVAPVAVVNGDFDPSDFIDGR